MYSFRTTDIENTIFRSDFSSRGAINQSLIQINEKRKADANFSSFKHKEMISF